MYKEARMLYYCIYIYMLFLQVMVDWRGMTESQRALWVLSRPTCAHINMAIQDFAGTSYHTSDQHATLTKSRKRRYIEDAVKVLQFCWPLNIFSEVSDLWNLVNDMNDDHKCKRAEEIGTDILHSMTEKTIEEFKFKKSKQVNTLDINHTVRFDKDTVKIEPELLFQWLVVCAHTNDITPDDLLTYELSTFPAAIFDPNGRMS